MSTQFDFERYNFRSELLLHNLPVDIKDILFGNREIRKFNKGEVIFYEGKNPDKIYYVNQGIVKKYTTGLDGQEHIFYICKKGEFLGHHAVLSNEPYSDSTSAILDSEISIIPRIDFIRAIEKSHTLCSRLLKSLSHEFSVFIRSGQILAQLPVRERTAIALLVLLEKFISNSVEHSETPIIISRKDLANMVGTAHETVGRIIHDFKEEGLILTKGRKIYIKNFEGLVEVSKSKHS